ncbi:nucleotidyltransferase family protein [Cohnella mopanensis]|uniref:nucleotidyltransferase family protein n=1 Tax=Cohnella mopanensis TaxID=2911966 RepID=UPI001EF921AB|nr:nucleotidyltransferase family protein [Cohnella mopanensis]
MSLEKKLIRILSTHPNIQRDLELVTSLNLPNAYIAAGYIRNYVWDYLHNNTNITALNDIDVIYYEQKDLSEETERRYESQLKTKIGEYNWSVKNQARMHLRNNEEPYLSVEDAMKRWPETVTAIGVTLDPDHNLSIIAPHGLDDLFSLTIRRSPNFQDRDYYIARVKSKKWMSNWPKLFQVDE